ncbi:Uu.00g036590.m01.CDS01 [Anthostomella pinea]|uniref:Uu.00g036590.m01.CDS01 n=1 Tax=Anthostomella pinea TaxID=933095 RepID=A0AAI8YDH0_9PEZI|nr:Uu.00g036590.m01.CDS01 [Anthostomella pinea]
MSYMMVWSVVASQSAIPTTGAQPLPAVDYTKSATEVFTEAARYTILESQDLLLCWAPDFESKPAVDSASNPINGLRRWSDTFGAKTKPLTTSDDNALHVQACAIGRVAHVSPVFDTGNYMHLCYDEFRKLPAPASETYEGRDERFWRTLILNIWRQGSTLQDNARAPAELGLEFRSLLAQERVLKILDCGAEQLRSPEIQARIAASPEVQALLQQCGRGGQYEALL